MLIDAALARYGMLQPGDAVLVGVSGGADSMALLHMLCALREGLGLRVYAAHVNHGLRGEEALRDENHVREICTSWGVGLSVLREDVRLRAARSGQTVEEAGRAVRYGFFQRRAQELGAKIATAHTLSDSIETFLFNFSRGTGLTGLCGIPPVRENIIRPLIETTRREIIEYCRENAICYMDDSTNFTREYSRNRLRLDAVPVFQTINPAFEEAALRTLRILGREEELLAALARETLSAAGDGKTVALAALRAAPPALLPRVLALAAKTATGSAQDYEHIVRLEELVLRGGGALQLRGGWIARVLGESLTFELPEPAGRPPEPTSSRNELAQGNFQIANFRFSIRFETGLDPEKVKKIYKPYFKQAIDCDRIIGTAAIRTRIPGDSYRPAGRGVTKTLKKLFQESSVKPEDRWQIPVISDEAGVLWVFGYGPDERCAVTEDTKNICLIETQALGGSCFV